MDLLDDNNMKKSKKTKGQKIVLTMLIISIVLTIIIFLILIFLKYRPQIQPYRIEIDGKAYSSDQLSLIELENGKKMIPIKILCDCLYLDYYNGEYNTTLEDKNKGYVDNGTNIIQFYSDSNKIFKTTEKTLIDNEYYEIKNDIILYNNLLYINLEDLNVALNLIQYYSEVDNKTFILSPEYWIENNNTKLEELGYKADTYGDNIKSLSYGYLIVKTNEKYGVIGLNNKQIIGNKYNNIQFVEYTGEFIVSNNNDQYGIINISGETKIQLQFEDIEVLNYNPLLYLVERGKQYGIIKEDGVILSEIKYTSFGFPENKENNSLYTLIIPELNSSIPKSIVVCIDNKYGLLDLENGEEIIPCSLKGIFLYENVEKNIKDYAVQLEDGTYNTLENYVSSLNKIVVNVN